MQTEHRKRGRPIGTGRHQVTDGPLLEQVADMMLAQPSATRTAIIKRVIPAHDTGGIRRLQRKFRDDEAQLMAGARTRAQARRDAEFRAMMARIGEITEAATSAMRRFVNSPEGLRLMDVIRLVDFALQRIVASAEIQPWLKLVSGASRLVAQTSPQSGR